MKRFVFAAALAVCSAALAGCGGDDITGTPDGGGPGREGGFDAYVPPVDAGRDASGEGSTPSDGGAEGSVDGGDASPPPERLLLSANNMSTSELVVVGVASGQVDGRLTYPGFIGTTSSLGPAPFLLEQAVDVVAELDPAQPWVVDASWNVALNDAVDGGSAYSDPDDVVVTAANKAYVLRYTRNEIAVLDVSMAADGGAPTGTIDLSSLVQPADTDGVVEMTAGAYDATRHLLYVVLGNIDRNTVVPPTYDLLCTSTVSSVVAVDTMTDQLASLGGTAPGGGIALAGFDPIFGGTVYDAANDRLLIDEAGCNPPPSGADAGPGPVTKRAVEQVPLGGGAPSVLLDLSAQGFPSELVYIDATHAVLGFDSYGPETATWDPTSAAIGPLVPNAPDWFAYDGAGNLLGTRADMTDAGSSLDVVRVRLADGTSTTLLSNPFSMPGGFVSGVELWPHP